MIGILALDLARWTGWARWLPGERLPTFASLHMPKTGDDVGTYLLFYRQWITARLDESAKIGAVVFETPWIGPDTHQATARKLMGLANETEVAAKLAGRKCYEANTLQMRKHFTGRGGSGARRIPKTADKLQRDAMTAANAQLKAAFKQLTSRECYARGWHVENDNEADACAVLDWASYELKADVPWDNTPKSARLGEGMQNASTKKRGRKSTTVRVDQTAI